MFADAVGCRGGLGLGVLRCLVFEGDWATIGTGVDASVGSRFPGGRRFEGARLPFFSAADSRQTSSLILHISNCESKCLCDYDAQTLEVFTHVCLDTIGCNVFGHGALIPDAKHTHCQLLPSFLLQMRSSAIRSLLQ